uniref:Uncharacterized protein n=1 Tax=Alexandrium catenella TaxID=2925 RepID=A0A7S1RYH8_ALECA|mmetsp:Transcript_78268/g.207720  ORF Transcript_78268/g.207720 Transcript_78268/m.207720 type:complete len:317 (+) Transcript_78268:85-1035(+)
MDAGGLAAMRAAVRNRSELDSLLGRKRAGPATGLSAGDSRRTLALLVVIPWLVFCAVVLLFTHVYSHAPNFLGSLLLICIVVCIRQSAVNYMRGSSDGAYAMALCVVAMLVGIGVGYHNYSAHMRPYWRYEEQRHYKDVGPEEPADALRDASAITFADGVRPDVQASVGFHAGPDIYCVAPIGTWDAGAASRTVQFWAAGKDCCQMHGAFTCDEATSPSAHGGLVINSHDDVDKYIHAVRIAESQNGAKTAEEPIFVRWVVNLQRARETFLNEAWIFWLLASLTYLPLSAALVVLAPSSLKSIEVISARRQEEYDG